MVRKCWIRELIKDLFMNDSGFNLTVLVAL